MEERLLEKMKFLTIVVVIAISGFGIVNTLYLGNRIEKLENKIESIKTFNQNNMNEKSGKIHADNK